MTEHHKLQTNILIEYIFIYIVRVDLLDCRPSKRQSNAWFYIYVNLPRGSKHLHEEYVSVAKHTANHNIRGQIAKVHTPDVHMEKMNTEKWKKILNHLSQNMFSQRLLYPKSHHLKNLPFRRCEIAHLEGRSISTDAKIVCKIRNIGISSQITESF